MLSVDEQASIIEELYLRYREPFTVFERNAGGLSLRDALAHTRVKNLYKQKMGNGAEKVGWYTHGINRRFMINDLAEAVRLRLFKDLSKDSIHQFRTFIRTKNKQEGEARKGTHDDFVMCWAIFFQIAKEMPRGDFKIISLAPKVGV